jgi:hypothetical protein
MRIDDTSYLSPVRGFLARRVERFPPDRRRSPTEADMRELRGLLAATGGDLEELVRRAACVLDTDDDSGAMRAYEARRNWGQIEAAAGEAAEARRTDVAVAKRGRGRPPHDRYEEQDFWLLAAAHARARAGCSTTQAIHEAVTAEWNRLGTHARAALGASIKAAVSRVFRRLTEIIAPGLRVRSLLADYFPKLAIAPRRARGVSEIGRPRAKQQPF